VVALHIELLNFTQAELRYVTHEIFKQNRILLQVAGCHEPRVHDQVVRLVMVAEQLQQMLLRFFLLYLSKLLDLLKEQIVKVFDRNFVITSVCHQVCFALLNHLDELVQLSLVFTDDKVFKDLEKESPVEAITVSSEATDLLVLVVEEVEAVLKLVGRVLLLQDSQVHQVGYEGHRLVNLCLKIILVQLVQLNLLRDLVLLLLLCGYFFSSHILLIVWLLYHLA